MKRLFFVITLSVICYSSFGQRYYNKAQSDDKYSTKVGAVTLTGIETLTNKTLTLPNLDGLKVSTVTVTSTGTELNALIGVATNVQSALDSIAVRISEKANTADIVDMALLDSTEVSALINARIGTATSTIYDTYILTIENSALGTVADNTPYYSGFPTTAPPDGNAGYHKIPILEACKLVGFSSSIRCDVASTSETFSIYVRKNNSSDYELASNFVTNAQYVPLINYSGSLDNNYAAGDYIEIKIATPVGGWATNPATVYTRFNLKFRKL